MAAPMHVLDVEIPAAWVDYNDHLNDAYHAVAFSQAGDAFMARVGLGPEGREATGRTIYTLSLIIRYLAEAKLGERLGCQRFRFSRPTTSGCASGSRRAASPTASSPRRASRSSCASTGPASGRAPPISLPTVAAKLEAVAAEHANLPTPLEAGQGLTLSAGLREFGDALTARSFSRARLSRLDKARG